MADFEELEPLFTYNRGQPRSVISLDDDDEADTAPALSPKRRKVSKPEVDKNKKTVHIIDDDDEEEDEEKENEDWLLPPPKVTCDAKILAENSTIRELRLKKQELLSIAQSAEDAIRSMEESAKAEIGKLLESSLEAAAAETERPKIVVSIQDKDGLKQFRIYSDDKFARLFKLYADKAKLDQRSLVFSFDGDKVGPEATPDGLGMEDNDIIEVHVKSS